MYCEIAVYKNNLKLFLKSKLRMKYLAVAFLFTDSCDT